MAKTFKIKKNKLPWKVSQKSVAWNRSRGGLVGSVLAY